MEEEIIRAVEIFALLSGLAYIVLEIKQKRAMWYLGIVTGLACACSFAVQRLWASAALNLYYVFVSFWGILQWKRAEVAVGEEAVHLNRLSSRICLLSALFFVAGALLLAFVLKYTGDAAYVLDAVVAVLSVIGTLWLAKSYPQQWWVWVLADVLSAYLCFVVGMYWMAGLYVVYIGSAVYGYLYWMKRGKFID